MDINKRRALKPVSCLYLLSIPGMFSGVQYKCIHCMNNPKHVACSCAIIRLHLYCGSPPPPPPPPPPPFSRATNILSAHNALWGKPELSRGFGHEQSSWINSLNPPEGMAANKRRLKLYACCSMYSLSSHAPHTPEPHSTSQEHTWKEHIHPCPFPQLCICLSMHHQ